MDNLSYALVVHYVNEKPVDWVDELAWEPHAVLDRTPFADLKPNDIFQVARPTDKGLDKIIHKETGYSFFKADTCPNLVTENTISFHEIVATPVPIPDVNFWYI